jgi:hypothetical protein
MPALRIALSQCYGAASHASKIAVKKDDGSRKEA